MSIYITPLIYLTLIITPFFTTNFLFRRQNKYDTSIIMFLDIESVNEFDNIYFHKKEITLNLYLENEDNFNLEKVEHFDIFGKRDLNDKEFEDLLFLLREFIDYSELSLKRNVYIILNSSDICFENYIKEYDIHKVINIGSLYGFYNHKIADIPKEPSQYLLNDVVVNFGMFNETDNSIIDLLDKW